MSLHHPRWEARLLHRAGDRTRARVAGRVVVEAPDAEAAQRAAQEALLVRARGERHWSLGVLRPLMPGAPGTRHYRVTFAEWVSGDDGYTRRDVHVRRLWAIDGASARRMAQEDCQTLPDYSPSWRIREVAREDPPAG
ncbi:MAG: hypothetical protein AB7V42_16330 [Thermoleophilia bacterium]